MADELVDIVDENNNLTGVRKMKSEAHRDGLWHRVIHVWLYNSKGEMLLQLRSRKKPFFPGTWDISTAGHVGAGEEPPTSAVREMEEEIGIKARENDLQFFKIVKDSLNYKDIINNEFCYIYFFKYDGDLRSMILQEEEVEEVKFFSTDKVESMIRSNPESFVGKPPYTLWFDITSEVRKRTGNLFKPTNQK
jgi:isopentenyl-diphosphate Delta-isomerase